MALQPLTFMGAMRVGLATLPYTVPANSFVTNYRWLDDTWISFDRSATERTMYQLRSAYKSTYLLNGGGNSDPQGGEGSIYAGNGLRSGNSVGPAFTPNAAPYALPDIAGGTLAVDITDFQDLIGAVNPTWDLFSSPAVQPLATAADDVKFAARTSDSSLNNVRLMVPFSFTPNQGWFTDTDPIQIASAWRPQASNGYTLSYYNGLFSLNNIFHVIISADGATITNNLIYQANQFGTDMLDFPAFAQPLNDTGFILTADGTAAGAGPLVADGSPIFLVAADLSAYWELVFFPTDAGVHPNDQGGYGPAWDMTFGAQVAYDPTGLGYYIQLDPTDPTVMDVYAFSPAAVAGGRVCGTFVGTAGGGNVLGGNS